jgi:hypothetical protein
MIEFTLIVLFAFLPLIFGTIEVGRGVWHYHQLSQLSREGARWLVVTPLNGTYHLPGNRPGSYTLGNALGYSPNTAVDWMARMEAGIPASAVSVQIQQLDFTQKLGITPPTTADYGYTHGIRVQVVATYPYQPLLTSILNIPATIPLRAETTMQLQ